MSLPLMNQFLLFQEDEFSVDSRHLTLFSPPSAKFSLEIVTEICPQKNTSLEVGAGFYIIPLHLTRQYVICLTGRHLWLL